MKSPFSSNFFSFGVKKISDYKITLDPLFAKNLFKKLTLKRYILLSRE